MDLNSLDTAASALVSQRLKMDVISSNLANITTTHDSDGNASTYRRKVLSFKTILDEKNNVGGVTVNSIAEDSSDLKAVYEPGHPDANEEGYVYYPNVSADKEMVDMITAKTAYEANIKSIQVFKGMFNAALEI
jgi:flagellar basal-body rod protein FlgC